MSTWTMLCLPPHCAIKEEDVTAPTALPFSEGPAPSSSAPPSIIGLKVSSYYVLVEQQSETQPSVCVSVDHIYCPPLLFQMDSIIASSLLQIFYRVVQERSRPG